MSRIEKEALSELREEKKTEEAYLYNLTDTVIHETATRNKYRKGYKKGYKCGYTRAIRELTEELKKKYPISQPHTGCLNHYLQKDIDEISDKLLGRNISL